MAVKKEAAADAGAACKAVEEWAIEKSVPGVYLAGLKQKKNWAASKMVTEHAFDAALQEFLSDVAGGRKK